MTNTEPRRLMTKIAGSLAAAGVLTLVGILGHALVSKIIENEARQDEFYRLSEEYVTGTVIKESGTVADKQKYLERSEGALFGNDSVRMGATYAIQFRSDDDKKVYNFAVNETYHHKLEALNMAIEEGTRVRMTKLNFQSHLNGISGPHPHRIISK